MEDALHAEEEKEEVEEKDKKEEREEKEEKEEDAREEEGACSRTLCQGRRRAGAAAPPGSQRVPLLRQDQQLL